MTETQKLTWTKKEDGTYLGNRGAEPVVALYKVGKRWFLAFKGRNIDLGLKATFDRAEGEMAKIGF